MVDAIFILLCIASIASSMFAVYAKEPINSAFGFLITILSLAGLFALLSASFLFLIQIIVYAGAVLTLILLIIMFLNIKEENLPKEPHKLKYMVLCTVFIIPIDFMVLKAISTLPKGDFTVLSDGFGSLKRLGEVLYGGWVLPFELISILLIVSLVGAIVFAKRKI